MNRCIFAICLFSNLHLRTSESVADISLATVVVADAGNGNDPFTGNLLGGVDYAYRIGATEVTNAQYAEFLNAKAASDPLALYNPLMGSNSRGGITLLGSGPNFTYVPKPDMGIKPVNFVSWYDAIRFANWLNNGQGNGDTETGAYTLGAVGVVGVPLDGASITRSPAATWFLPTENEWYKAAYYQPAAAGGNSDNYWLYATASNSAPTIATAIDSLGSTRGDAANPGLNVANYKQGAIWNDTNGNVTTVGSAGPSSQSFYGTSDQGGNVWEWNETLINGSDRGLRVGSYGADANFLAATYRGRDNPAGGPFEGVGIGFRVATVPEPSTFALSICAAGAFWFWRRYCAS